MIHTEQLSPDTIMLHICGPFYEKTAKELSLIVFRSHRLGFKTFLCNLSQVSLIDDRGHSQLAMIGEGLQSKGLTWRVIKPLSSGGDQLIFRTSLQHITPAMWN